MEAIGDNDLCVSAYHTGTVYRADRNMKVTHPSCQLEYLLFYDSTPGHSMLIRKDFIRRISQEWDGHILYDWWIAVNAHLNHGLTCVDQPLTHPAESYLGTLHLWLQGLPPATTAGNLAVLLRIYLPEDSRTAPSGPESPPEPTSDPKRSGQPVPALPDLHAA